ncbi:MAG: pseudouridine-5'-phosphate glycosidase [Cetobacterium sp.]|uniref:pseudouridine-5'-phosphate glycosidase n=1 Tax=unclassified Cetobacterium TaxID=2630983 RepID=UPI00163C341F|nr:pseudouridine-5'-phosphate glycosidase [Cetobacterium sp. 2A]MBC2856705.1 pseudouridine-5'-phosphate glycosidase [Cetobacterium sp. 2A]
MLFYEKYIDISQEVLKGFKENSPVIGIDSTILSNFSYPENLKRIYEIEDKIRSNGGVPGIMVILNGRLKVGVSKDELEILAKMEFLTVASKKDIPYLILKRESGVLSFDSALAVGILSGLKVFLTGYLTCDKNPIDINKYIYKDLCEYSFNNIAVISSGIRSEAEMNLIVKNFETNDVPIIGYQIENIPIYNSEKIAKVNYKIETPSEIVSFLTIKWELGITGGVIIFNEQFDEKLEKQEEWKIINLKNLTKNIKIATTIGSEIYRIK